MVKIAAAVRKRRCLTKQQYKVVAFVFWDWLSCSPSWLTVSVTEPWVPVAFLSVVSFRAYRVFGDENWRLMLYFSYCRCRVLL